MRWLALAALAVVLTLSSWVHAQTSNGSPSTRVGLFSVPGLALADDLGKPAGLFTDILAEMQRAGGQQFEVTMYPSIAALLEALETGEVDVAGPIPHTSQRAKTLLFTESLSNAPSVILGRAKERTRSLTLADLSGRRVASMARGAGHEILRIQQPAVDILTVESGAEAVKAVAFGEADFAVMSLPRAAHYVQTLGLINLSVVGQLPYEYQYAFAMLRNTSAAAFQDFAARLASIDAGTRRDMTNRWLTSLETPLAKRLDLQLVGLVLLVTLAASGSTILAYRARLKVKEAALHESNALLERTAQTAQVGGWSLELDKRRLRWSKQTYAIYGCDPEDFVPTANNSASFFTPESALRLRGAMLLCMRQAVAFDKELELLPLRAKRSVWVRATGTAECLNGRIVRVFGTVQDIDVIKRQQLELAESERRFRHQACHDPLTDLANRAALMQHLPQATARAELRGGAVAVLFLDADNFKHINDARGHSAGDELLRRVAQRLLSTLGEAHFISRVGGDEFVVVVEGTDTRSSIETIAPALVAAAAHPVELLGGPEYLTVSVGVALYPDHGTNTEELLAAADTAMYAAKDAGRNTWKLYDAQMGCAVAAKLKAQQNLRSAFENGELVLHYQPKLSLTDGSVCGAEALLRWNSPDGLKGPTGFIQAAEDSGFIRPLGQWVIEQAARQVQSWRATGLTVPVAVNVSAKQFQDNEFVPFLRELIERDPSLPALLELEITESALVSDAEHAVKLFTDLKAMGFRLHIDDFGTGYSSLSYLSRMPVDSLKIDRSFVADIPGSAQACGIARAVLAVAHSLGLEVIAEGVETLAQASFLLNGGCEMAQGFLYSKAVPADQLEVFIRRHAHPSAAVDACV